MKGREYCIFLYADMVPYEFAVGYTTTNSWTTQSGFYKSAKHTGSRFTWTPIKIL